MTCDITNPVFTDEHKARQFLEASRWPDGPVCPHCGQLDTVKVLGGKSMGPGWYFCGDCREKFTVRVGTLYERSHIPLHKWLVATHLMVSSKKGISALQLSRMLGITYKSAWFMSHRIREQMTLAAKRGPLGGEGKIVEADETWIGGKEANKHVGVRNKKNIGGMGKKPVMALTERGGESRSFRIASVSGKTLRPVLVSNVSRKSSLMTDQGGGYFRVGKEFARHETVNHGADEYVRGDAHTNTSESRFSLMKRAVYGAHHNVSEAHLTRYLAEWDFKWNTRKISDGERAAIALKGIEGKRLTYRPADKTTHA
ncbi:MAG TPA: IS1595 family transposase [Xanthobacteraceae bacterium]|nr:IS1595 family transposase [Xanthobacteraceae bacterium]